MPKNRRTKLLMSLEEEQPVANVSQSQRDCIVAELQGQVLALAEQIAALKHQNKGGSGHIYEHTRSIQCLKSGNLGTFVVIIIADSISETSMGYCKRQQSFRTTESPPNFVTVTSTRSEVLILKGKIDGVSTEIMLHSGSSVSPPTSGNSVQSKRNN